MVSAEPGGQHIDDQHLDDITRLVVVTPVADDAPRAAEALIARARERGAEVVMVDAAKKSDLLIRLVALIGDGRHTLVLGSAAAATAAERTGARLVDFSPGGRSEAAQPADTALDDLHADQADPWGADSRWYEARKRALLLAALPRRRFRHGLELGSSTGALAADLAARCEDLLVIDASARAVSAARSRLAHLDGVRVEEMAVPSAWPVAPAGGFDLVVLSEVGYFLSPRGLDEVIELIRADLADDGVLVLCHWRHEIVGWPLDGPDVHRVVTAAGVRPVVAEYQDRDVALLVLTEPDNLPDPTGA